MSLSQVHLLCFLGFVSISTNSVSNRFAFTKRRREFRERPRTRSGSHFTFILISGELNRLLNNTFLNRSPQTVPSQCLCFVWRQSLCPTKITQFILSVNLNLIFYQLFLDNLQVGLKKLALLKFLIFKALANEKAPDVFAA